ncbi:MAG: DUF4234 domain-containing protein [Spirochaetales bacterium]|nr:DUF4234 domain-containing protein [Spirochaetales bacterium]
MKYRSIPLCILLSVLTLGIFYLYWFYKITSETINELEYNNIDNPLINLLYLVLGLFFYNIWWNYKISAYLATIEKESKVETDFWSTPLSVIYGVVLHQSRINRVLGTKYKTAKTTTKRKSKTASTAELESK